MTLGTTDSLLKGIGCNMQTKAPKTLFPEECLVELSRTVLADPKALVLVTGAIARNVDIFHPEFLFKLLKSRQTDTNVIGGLLCKTKDRRFLKIIQYCHELNYKSARPSKTLAFATQIGQAPVDRDFAEFGLKISEMNQVDEKKLTKRELWAQNNIFIHNRILFGCNWRADIISAIEIGAKNPTEVKNRLKCSYETAHRVFNDYKLIQKIEGSVA
jgi:hypothetical protein